MKLAKGSKGTSIVETAIALPLLLLLIFGIAECGIILYDKAVITNASREGARAGIVQALVRADEAAIRSVVNSYASARLINFGSASLNTSVPDAPCTGFGSPLTVNVSYRYHFLVLPFVSSVIGPVDMGAKTVMKCE